MRVKRFLGSLSLLAWALIQASNCKAESLAFEHRDEPLKCANICGTGQVHAPGRSRTFPIPLPLEDVYRASYNDIEYLKLYLSHIDDPNTRQLFENEMIHEIDEFQANITKEYKSLFKEAFPNRLNEAFGLTFNQEERLREKMVILLWKLDAMNWNITRWVNQNAFIDLSRDEIRNSILTQAEKIWSQQFQSIKETIDWTLLQFAYKGYPLQYVGSLNCGTRGEHKGRTVININDFDVDLFVRHSGEWHKHLPIILEEFPENFSNGKIFPVGTHMHELHNLSYAVGQALERKLRDRVKNAWKFINNTEIVLREED